MDREAVVAVVRKHLLDVLPELRGAEIEMNRSMRDLGANSLDIVEVVSCAMRELKVKIPRSELGRAQNMSGLVDLLHAAANHEIGAPHA